jgi:hypothetical protein
MGRLFKEIMAINSSNLGRLIDIPVCKVQKSPEVKFKEEFTKTHYNQIVKNQRQRNFGKHHKEGGSLHMRDSPENINLFPRIKIAGTKRITCYSQMMK